MGVCDFAGFDDGSPDGNDPLQLARQMASRGITLVRSSPSVSVSDDQILTLVTVLRRL